MSSFVQIAGKKYESVITAAALSGYSRDYIGRLAREQKILATQVGRQWFVFIPSLLAYVKISTEEQNLRKRELSSLRKKERATTSRLHGENKTKATPGQGNKFYPKVVALAVLSLGVGLGATLNAVSLFDFNLNNQIASAPKVGDFKEVAEEFPVATGKIVESTELQSIDFSKESMTVSTLDADGKGVLLLPNSSDKNLTAQEIKDFFSDPVKIVRDEIGNSYVVRTNSNGIEEQLPFAVVPVTNQDTP